jgi:NAD(P)-dependent dehydrogenase (short-subunit alcohol dehydrogenase family)
MGAMATYDLSGKVALVTGGARGIGFATAQALSDRGASVVIVDLDVASAEAAAARLHDSRALGLAADVTDRAAMQRAVATTVERFGGLDVVVANAGIASRGATFRATSTETFDRVIDVNLMGVVRTVEAALPQIVARQGHVVVVASVYAFINGMGAVPYAMAKAGVEQLGRALRVELTPFGASATTAYFGFIDTEMVHKALDQDPLSDALMAVVPKPLRKRLPPKVAGEAIVAGIEKRAARVIRPRRWTGLSVIRGAINPITDRLMERNAETHDLVRQFDAREGEEQPTTA